VPSQSLLPQTLARLIVGEGRQASLAAVICDPAERKTLP